MLNTLRARGGSIENYRQRDHDDAAIEWQVDFLFEKLPFNLYAYEDDYEGGLIHIAGPYTTKDEIRETLKRYPRDEFMFQYEYYQPVQVFRRRPGRKFRSFFWIGRKHKPRDLPLSFNHGLARYCGQRFRTLMWLPDGELSEAGTEGGDCSRIRRSPKGASAWQILSHFKQGSWGVQANSPVRTTGRGRIINRIASEMAAQGATADEIETVIRASPAFQSKSSDPREEREGQGARWGEQEIQRMRAKAK